MPPPKVNQYWKNSKTTFLKITLKKHVSSKDKNLVGINQLSSDFLFNEIYALKQEVGN